MGYGASKSMAFFLYFSRDLKWRHFEDCSVVFGLFFDRVGNHFNGINGS